MLADFTITISNSINTFGPAPSSKWNAYNWNAFRWGEGTTDLITETDKLLANATTLSDAFTMIYEATLTIANSLSLSTEPSIEYLTDRAGFYYVFAGGVTNADSRVSTTYSTVSTSAAAWSAASSTSSVWS